MSHITVDHEAWFCCCTPALNKFHFGKIDTNSEIHTHQQKVEIFESEDDLKNMIDMHLGQGYYDQNKTQQYEVPSDQMFL